MEWPLNLVLYLLGLLLMMIGVFFAILAAER
jgi:hypothetical protein